MSFSSSNDWLDHQLRQVRLPDGLHERLRRITQLDDKALDAALRDVATPPGLTDRLTRISVEEHHRDERRRQARRRPTVAAGLLVAVGVAYLAGVLGAIWSTFHASRGTRSATLAATAGAEQDWSETSIILNRDFLAEELPAMDFVQSFRQASTIDAVSENEFIDAVRALTSRELSPREPAGFHQRRRWISDEYDESRLLADTSTSGLGAVLADGRLDEQLRLEMSRTTGKIPRGMDLPSGHLLDRLFLLKYGLFPPLPIKEFPVSVVPLAAESASFDMARDCLASGEWPAANRIRTEEFLAAADYGFDRPTNRPLNLVVTGGPSPLGSAVPLANVAAVGPGGLHLLQIGVQARDLPLGKHRPVQLTIALDISASMSQGNRIEMVRRALENLADSLGPQDRLSLIAFNDRAHVLVEGAGPRDVPSWRAAVASLQAAGATHPAAGLLVALGAASSPLPPKGMARQMILITDGLAEFDPAALERVEQTLAKETAAGLRLNVIDLSPLESTDPQLQNLARLGRGKVRQIGASEQIHWVLAEELSGRSQVVAADARLTVAFNPKGVATCRLLGYEPSIMAGHGPTRIESPLHGGQTATALFELQLMAPSPPSANADVEVATIQLEWSDPASGKRLKVSNRLMRSQLRASFAEAAPSLQLATLVAGTAEILRESPYAAHLTPSDVLQWSRQMSIGVGPAQRANFREWVALVQQMEQLMKSRRSGRTGRPR